MRGVITIKKICGGMANLRGVTFLNKDFVVTVKRGKVGDIIIHKKKRSANKNLLGKLLEIPFLRGPAVMFNVTLLNYKLVIVMVILLALISRIFDIDLINGNDYWLMILPVLLIKLTPYSKYHAAEHMAYNTLLNNLPLTMENAKKQKMTCRYCGTNLAVFILLIFFALIFLLPMIPEVLSFLISLSLGHEIFRIKDIKYLKHIYRFGDLIQYLCFTRKPKESEIEVALKSLRLATEITKYSS